MHAATSLLRKIWLNLEKEQEEKSKWLLPRIQTCGEKKNVTGKKSIVLFCFSISK